MLAPLLTQPLIAVAAVAALVALGLAVRSVALPLALAGIPNLISATLGHNPLPKGGATLLIGAWIAAAVGLAALRGESRRCLPGLMSSSVLFALLLLGLMLLRLGSSIDQSYGSTKVELYVANNVLFLIAGVFVGADRLHTRTFFRLTLVIVAISSFLLVGELVGGGAQQQYSGRFTLDAQQGSINLGRDSATGALIAIALMLMGERLLVRLAALAVLPALLVALLAAGSRGPTIGFVLGLGVLLTLTAAAGRSRRRLLLVGFVLVGAAGVIPLVVPGSSIGRALSAIVGGASGLSSNGRSGIWSKALALFGAHPISGLGTGGFGAIDPEMYPHNLFLESAVELGLVGLLLMIGMVWSMLRNLIALWRTTAGEDRLGVTLLLALFVSALFNAMVSGAIPDNADVWLWGGLGLGVLARYAPPQAVRVRRGEPMRALGTLPG